MNLSPRQFFLIDSLSQAIERIKNHFIYFFTRSFNNKKCDL